jgi:peroxiredoxin
MRTTAILSAAGLSLIIASCSKEPPAGQGTQTSAQTPAAPTTAAPANAAAAPVAEGTANAEVGKPAPDFTLKDLDGKETKLSAYKGKVVVLEWFNPGCPFVKKSHTKGSLVTTAKKHTKNGVVWLAVNSGAAGKQGAGAEANREGAKTFNLDHPILLDDSGAVGKLYGATNTPHMFVIDDKGTLVYKGAIDNSPDGEGESPTGGKLVSYVDEAIASIGAGKPVATAETKAYGCGVKYK